MLEFYHRLFWIVLILGNELLRKLLEDSFAMREDHDTNRDEIQSLLYAKDALCILTEHLLAVS